MYVYAALFHFSLVFCVLTIRSPFWKNDERRLWRRDKCTRSNKWEWVKSAHRGLTAKTGNGNRRRRRIGYEGGRERQRQRQRQDKDRQTETGTKTRPGTETETWAKIGSGTGIGVGVETETWTKIGSDEWQFQMENYYYYYSISLLSFRGGACLMPPFANGLTICISKIVLDRKMKFRTEMIFPSGKPNTPVLK